MKKRTLLLLVFTFLGVGKYCFENYSLVAPAIIPDLKPILASYQSSAIERYSFGFNNLIGASIWVKLLQNSDHRPVQEDRLSWEYAQLDALTTLDPNNFRAYDFGSIFISTLRRDKVGGKLLIEKWTKKRPNFWRPWYLLGMHHILELKDYASAPAFILKASKMHGAPEWLSSLGIRLMSESGRLYPALKISLELLPQLRNPEAIERVAFRIRSLNYRIQKNQWQEMLNNYLKSKHTIATKLDDLKAFGNSSNRELSSIVEAEKNNSLAQFLLSETFIFKIDPNKKEIVSAEPEKTDILEKVGIFTQN
ncbi:MAG: hypothetical protein EBR01_03015 [Proteobacteria bacterium]|nr:hypothetical protein [Pseudomonadota bacterium]